VRIAGLSSSRLVSRQAGNQIVRQEETQMDAAHNLVVMLSGTLAFLVYFFPISLGVAVLWLRGLLTVVRHSIGQPGRVAGWCLLPACLTIGLLVVGTVFANDGSRPSAHSVWLVGGLVMAHLPLSGVLVWRARDQWPLVAASSAVWGWVSVCAALVAGMSVTGDWL
jgi:hypothetical protein